MERQDVTIEFAGVDCPAKRSDLARAEDWHESLVMVLWRVSGQGASFVVPVPIDRRKVALARAIATSLKDLHRLLRYALDAAEKMQPKPGASEAAPPRP